MQSIKTTFQKFIIVACCVALSSCWVPEEFAAKVTINNDGSYVVSYEGTLAFVPALMAMNENRGKLSKDDTKFLEMEKSAKSLERAPGMKRVESIGDGRIRVSFERKIEAGKNFYFLDKDNKIIAVERLGDGGIRAGGASVKPDDLVMLQSLKAKFGGTFNVSLGGDLKVFYSNATSKPGMFGGAYGWDIKKPSEIPPGIIVYPKSVTAPTLVEDNICVARKAGAGWLVGKYIKNDKSIAMFPKVKADGSYETCEPKPETKK